MPPRIHRLRALKDNYCFLLHAEGSRSALVIDPGDAGVVRSKLVSLGLDLKLILNTHHHHDHIGGNLELQQMYGCPIWCSEYDRSRIPGSSVGLADNTDYEFAGFSFRVLAIPGHTQGQIAFHFADAHALFAGDTLFSMGCGRLFEGTAEQMWQSLERLKRLPMNTLLYFGHEYTEINAAFSLSVEPENASAITSVLERTRRALGESSLGPVPELREELLVNSFLRAKDLSTFTTRRALRDVWT